MRLSILCSAAAAVLVAYSASAQMQSGSNIGSNPGLRSPGIPSTGTSGDAAGSAGTTAPRSTTSTETSVGASGATSGPAATDRSSGLCDTLTGDERARCLREQAATGTQGGGSAGTGSTGSGTGTTGSAGIGGGATPGTGR